MQKMKLVMVGNGMAGVRMGYGLLPAEDARGASTVLHADTLASTAALSHQAPTLRQVLRRRTKGIPARCLPFTPRAS